ncbi:Retrovirus-related Pol polyprotein from transposon 17.6 [Dictyocoela muelleri]|nr:Retrovirus-related Pol polyprotein from transposon 17.6 [Dictyocoela muelleri]
MQVKEVSGGVIYQKHGVLEYYSHKFNDTEINYSIVEKEVFAIVKTIKRFRTILLNCTIKLRTDNRNALFKAKKNSRINRWKESLNEYNIEIEHISGKNNIIADLISRKFSEEHKMFSILDTNSVLDLHNKFGHPGKNRTYKTIKNGKNSRIKYSLVVDELSKCLECRLNTVDKNKYGKIQGCVKSNRPIKIISSDIIGPFKSKLFNIATNKEKFFILSITDIFSRYTDVYYMEDITSKAIILKGFNKFFSIHGKPDMLISDNGRQYLSLDFSNFLKENNIKHIKTTPYNPTSNGISERLNQTILKTMKIYKGGKISRVPRYIKLNLNEAYNTAVENFPIDILEAYKNKNHIFIQKIKKKINEDKRNLNLKNINKNRKDFEY